MSKLIISLLKNRISSCIIGGIAVVMSVLLLKWLLGFIGLYYMLTTEMIISIAFLGAAPSLWFNIWLEEKCEKLNKPEGK